MPKRRRIYVRQDKYSKKLRANVKLACKFAEAQAYICAKHKYSKAESRSKSRHGKRRNRSG